MSEALFKIGRVYRNKFGAPCEVLRYEAVGALAVALQGSEMIPLIGTWDDASGEWSGSAVGMALIPGELEFKDGQWIAVEDEIGEAELAALFAEAWEGAKVDIAAELTNACRFCGTPEGSYHVDGCVRLEAIRANDLYLSRIDPNAAMIARDGPARPAPVVIQEPTKTLAHAPIEGLTRFTQVDHRLGSAYR